MPMLPKALDVLSSADIQALCTEQWTEDEQMDFKETIPHREVVGADPWRDQKSIKDYGRDQLLATLVAFANSYGGDLIIGVRESADTRPGRAEAVVPLSACREAAERLAQAARSCIDPPIPGLQVRGLEFGEGDAGCIVLRAPRSRLAPHRLLTTHATMKEAFHRVRHETVAMSMKQIQELTFSVSRGMDQVARNFIDAQESFRDWALTTRVPEGRKLMAMRFTAVPTSGDVYIERVHNVTALRPQSSTRLIRLNAGSEPIKLSSIADLYNWRPVLRGTAAEDLGSDRGSRAIVRCDGVITCESYFHVDAASEEAAHGRQRSHLLHPGWVFGPLINTVEAADRFRTEAGAPAVEYGLEVEIFAHGSLPVLLYGDAWHQTAGVLNTGHHVYPRYAFGPKESWQDSLLVAHRDFWNSIGVDPGTDTFEIVG